MSVSTLTAAAGNDQPRASVGEATSLFNVADYQKRIGLAAETPVSPVETTASRWCFVAELFHRVILPDPLGARVAFASRRHDTRRRIICSGASRPLAPSSASCSFGRGGAIRNCLEMSSRHRACSTPLRRMFGRRHRSRPCAAWSRYARRLRRCSQYERDRAPWRLRWGLYAGNRGLPAAYDLYFQRFRQFFYDDVHGSIAATLAPLARDARSEPVPTMPFTIA